MSLDPSIPLQVRQPSLADMYNDAYRARAGQVQLQQAQQKLDDRQTLAGLLPRAVQGDKQAISGLYAVDPDIALKLDERQRAAAKETVADLHSAVQWAKSPDDWAKVQSFYGSKGVDLSQYEFKDREQALIALGQMGKYLEATQPKVFTTTDGGGAFTYQPGNPSQTIQTLVQPNDGSQPMGAPVNPNPRQITGQQDYDALPPGAEYIDPNGVRRRKGGGAGNGTGGFR